MRFEPKDGIQLGVIVLFLYGLGLGIRYLVSVSPLRVEFYTVGPFVIFIVFTLIGTFFDVLGEETEK